MECSISSSARARKVRATFVAAFLLAPVGCGGASPPPAEAPPAAPVSAPSAAPMAPASPAPGASAAAAPAAPAAEKKNAEDALPTPEDYANAEAAAKKEADRFTPELRAKAKALADASYPSLKAAVSAVLASPHRKPGSADRDKYRHPLETLELMGVTPKSTVLEYGPGEGWYTELLAPVLAKKGKLLVTMPDPKGPEAERSTLGARRTALMLDKSSELFGKVERVVIDPKKPALPEDGTVDVVLMFRVLHGMVRAGQTADWLAAVHRALKPNGVLGMEQHRALSDAKPEESANQGYLPEEWVIHTVEAAGFKLAGKSEVNANPLDTKNYPEGVWTLPPTLRMKDKDRDKYIAIGESDRMTLKFVKVGK